LNYTTGGAKRIPRLTKRLGENDEIEKQWLRYITQPLRYTI